MQDKNFKVKSDAYGCTGCARGLDWLDVIHTAIVRGHPPSMLAATFRGEYGNIVSPPLQSIVCSACQQVREKTATKYGCGGYTCHKYS